MALQVKAGLTHLSSGFMNWQDLFRPLVDAWEGFTLGGLTRWFDNNNFYRQPVISSEPMTSPIQEEYIQRNRLLDGHPRLASLPGPYTFYDLSEDRHFLQPEEAIVGLAECLAKQAQVLAEGGFDLVQFHEPSIVVNPPDSELLQAVIQAYEKIGSAGAPRTTVQLYFAPVGPVLEGLLDLKVDSIGLDLYEEDLEVLKDIEFSRGLACGCLDARNSLMETPKDVAAIVRKARDDLSPPSLSITTNSSLELLPRPVAEEKMMVLGRARELLEVE